MRGRFTRWALLVALVLPACGGESHKTIRGDGSEVALDVVDYMEDGAEGSFENPTYFLWRRGLGNWFVTDGENVNDVTVDTIEPPRGESTKACHLVDSGRALGVDLLAQLDHPMNHPVPLDGYSGVAFWTKLQSPSSKLVVALGVGLGYFAAASEPTPPPAVALAASPDWQFILLPFDKFGAVTGGVASIDFIAGAGGEDFDLWVDDLAFVCDGACPTE